MEKVQRERERERGREERAGETAQYSIHNFFFLGGLFLLVNTVISEETL